MRYTTIPGLSSLLYVPRSVSFLFLPTANAYSRRPCCCSYCPTFGGGHDLYIQSNCQDGSTRQSTYSRAGPGQEAYSSTWLLGSSTSFRLDAIEVFYLSDEETNDCFNLTCAARDQCHIAGQCLQGICTNPPAPNGRPCSTANSSVTSPAECVAGVCQAVPNFTPTNSFIATGLEKYRSYQFHVRARTQAGAGMESGEFDTITLQDSPSGPPTDVTTRVLSATSVIVSWRPPRDDDQNGVILGYELSVHRTAVSDVLYFNTSDLPKMVARGDFLQHSVADLDPNTE